MNFSIMSPLISFLLLIFITVIHCNKTVRNEAGSKACGTAPYNPNSPNNRGAQSHNIQLWTNGIVPFEITSYMNADDEAVARRAMSDIEESTCIRFKERKGESAYIRMSRACKQSTGECIDSSAVYSHCNPNECFGGAWVQGLGQGSPSELFIGKTTLSLSNQGSIGLFIHEILHSLGVEHTQRRPDRDRYIVVKNDSITPYGEDQYKKCPTCLTYNTPYDCMSVMHYRDSYFSKNGAPTMIPAPGNANCDLKSSANVLTSADKELLNSMYQCRRGVECNDGEVELTSYPKGKVKLCKNGKWGTLCGHYWWDNQKGAENICKQLGYSGGRKYTAPGGTGPIHAGNRLCKGGEKTIWDCPLQWGRQDTTGCSHAIDQGVDCFLTRTVCEPGWSTFGSSCYKYFQEKWTFKDAENKCVSEGGHVSSIHSNEENAFVAELGSIDLWVGAQWTGSEWKWEDESSWGYTHWWWGEPNDPNYEPCIALWTGRDSKWNDVWCTLRHSFVCKKNM